MKEKFVLFFKSKTFLIIASLICAIIAWLFVLNFTNPITERAIEVPITLANSESLEKNEIINTTANVPEKATVTVKGRQSVLQNLAGNDFYCEYNLASATASGTKMIDLSKPVCSKVGVKIIKYSPQSTLFSFDKASIANLQVVVEFSDMLLKEGYEFISVTPDKESIQVSGLESDIMNLDYISVRLDDIFDLHSIDSSKSASYIGNFIDKNGMDVTSKFDPVSIIVKMDVGMRVKVNYSVTGKPDDDYFVNSDSISNDRILIYGSSSELKKIKNINAGTINVDGVTETVNKEIDLSDCLPDGVSVYGNSKVTITAEILPLEKREFTFNVMNEVKLDGYDTSGYVYKNIPENITVILKGKSEVLDELKKSSLSPTLDLTDCHQGIYPITLNLSTEGTGVELVGEYSFVITISEKTEQSVK